MVKPVALPESPDWVERVKEKAFHNMSQHESCSQSILAAFMDELGIEDPLVIRAAGGFHGGLVSSLTCGIHMAGAMVLGLLIGREKLEGGLDGLMPIIVPTQDLIKRLNKRLGSSSCKELTGVDFTDMEAAIQFYVAGDNKKCFDRVAEGAEEIALFLKELEASGQLFRAD
jgi:C_GCAxxG_C_C family probable redox protein